MKDCRRSVWIAAGVVFLAAGISGGGGMAGESAAPPPDGWINTPRMDVGLVVVIGGGDGTTAIRLARAGALVHVLLPDEATVARTRETLRAAGVYGRASADLWSSGALPYADNLVNRIVAEGAPWVSGTNPDPGEIRRVLVPLGVVETPGGKPMFQKNPAPEMAEWTHARCGPDGNPVLADMTVGPPGALRWADGPTWARSHAIPGDVHAMVASDGAVYVVADEAPRSVKGPPRLTLTARDAWNGLVRWKRALPGVFPEGPLAGEPWRFPTRTLVAGAGRIYAAGGPGTPLVELDRWGDGKRSFPEAGVPVEAVLAGENLLVAGRELASFETAGGGFRWKQPVAARNLIAAGDRLYYQAGEFPGDFAAAELKTGREVWRVSAGAWARGRQEMLFSAGGRIFLGGVRGGQGLHALSAADGRHLWSFDYRPLTGFNEAYAARGLVWVNAREGEGTASERWVTLGLDPVTGQPAKRIEFPADYPASRGHHRCYGNRATGNFLILGTHGTDFVDLAGGRVTGFDAICGSCGFGVVPSNGLLYAPPFPCVCDPFYRGFLAVGVAPAKTPAGWGEILERGPARGTAAGASAAGDWPTYRADAARSGATSVVVPVPLARLWKTAVGGRPSAPVVAGGRVFVSVGDGHQILALDAETGDVRWRFTAGGPVDSPPTVAGDLCVFGCRDGWVYAIRAPDGALVWRLRVAPGERRIVAWGALESPWPVHGSVLVRDGVVYFAAGRTPILDGGVRVFAVEAATGKILWKVESPALADVLMAGGRGGTAVRLREMEFDPATGVCRRGVPPEDLQTVSGLLDGTFASRGRWMKGNAVGELLVFTREKTWGFAAFPGSYAKNDLVEPGKGEYRLFAREGGRDAWRVPVSLRVRGMALAGEILFAAGVLDTVGEGADFRAPLTGNGKAELQWFAAADGAARGSLSLEAAPVFDGLAAADGKIFMATEGGTVEAYGRKLP
ncbi:MAG: PQQ-binding-like beta-propeller repeat protein [Planctomycetota bacterium]